MTLHEMVHKCQKIIISSLLDASAECTVLLAKNRIDESNILKVEQLADSLLDETKAEQVHKALDFMKRALSDICEEHAQWAMDIGEMYGRRYQIDHIDTVSLSLEGLYKAAIRFQPRGSFKSYASSWIRQCIQRYIDINIMYTLNSPIKQGEQATHMEYISSDDIVWGSSSFYANDPHVLEDLRDIYCKHLTLSQVKNIVNDKELAIAVGC